MTLETILYINDDTPDILALQSRLKGVHVIASTQYQARVWALPRADLIIIDNDANNLEKAKGPETLVKVRKRLPDVPIVYTSFQPGMVVQEVRATEGVKVIKTSNLPAYLSSEFGISVAKPKPGLKAQGETTIVLSYNDVTGYPADMYGNGKLLVVSYDRCAKEKAKQVLMDCLRSLYKEFDWSKDRHKVKNVFVYDGTSAGENASYAGASLGHDLRMKVHMLTCKCDVDRKRDYQDSLYVDLTWVECGGRESTGCVADTVLGINRVGFRVDEDIRKHLTKLIAVPAEKYQI